MLREFMQRNISYIIYRVTVFWRKLAHLYEIPTYIDLEYLESTDLKQIIDTNRLFISSNSPFWSFLTHNGQIRYIRGYK